MGDNGAVAAVHVPGRPLALIVALLDWRSALRLPALSAAWRASVRLRAAPAGCAARAVMVITAARARAEEGELQRS